MYSLTVGKDGPKFHESTAGPDYDAGCNGRVHKICRKVTMEMPANILSQPHRVGMVTDWSIDRFVLDVTGLKGTYDFTLDAGLGGRSAIDDDPAAGSAQEVFRAADAVTALGLRLESAKQAYDFVIVDHVERVPTAN